MTLCWEPNSFVITPSCDWIQSQVKMQIIYQLQIGINHYIDAQSVIGNDWPIQGKDWE